MKTEPRSGEIRFGSAMAALVGFHAEDFAPSSYLWKIPGAVVCSFVETTHPGTGQFRNLVSNILALGLDVKVPTPLGRMGYILRNYGFEKTTEIDEHMGPVEVWVLKYAR